MFLALIVFASLSASVFSVNATPAGAPTFLGPILVSQATNYEPFPVEPGELFDFWVRVENPGAPRYLEIPGVECQLVQRFPFAPAEPSDELRRFVGTLGPSQVALLKFKMRADENAASGKNDLTLRCRTSSVDWTSIDLGVFVQVRDPVLSVEGVNATPAEFVPGGSGSLEVTLENKASVSLRNVQVKLDLSSPSLPVSPEKSSGDAFIERVPAKQKGVAAFSLITSPSAEAGVYKLPGSLAYQDDSGTKFARNFTLAVVVDSPPNVLFSLERSDVLRPGSKGKAVIAVTNRGLSDVKRLAVSFGKGAGYELLSAPTSYLGDIDRDDFETVEIELFVSAQGGELAVPVTYSFLDAFNRGFEKSEFVSLRVYSPSEVAALQLEQATGGLNYLLIAAIVLVLAYLAFRWYSHRRRQQ